MTFPPFPPFPAYGAVYGGGGGGRGRGNTIIRTCIGSHEPRFQEDTWAVVAAGMVMAVGVGGDGGALKELSGNTLAARLVGRSSKFC